MLCADTSCWIAYLQGERAWDVDFLDASLASEAVVMAPVVLAEIFSDPALGTITRAAIRSLPLLEASPGYWERTGLTRALLRRHSKRPKLADTLIAQTCLDHRVPLLTRDRDFDAFWKHAGLQLVHPS